MRASNLKMSGLADQRPVSASPRQARLEDEAQESPATWSESESAMALRRLREWVEKRQYAGCEPYDILNSRLLPTWISGQFPLNWLLIQAGKHFPGNFMRKAFQVPASVNPKGVGLFLHGYCDLARCGDDTRATCEHLKSELQRLRSPNENHYCWGYDWDYVSLRGSSMRAFSPNAIASAFCGQALLEMAAVFSDSEAAEMASSVGEFFLERLNRPVDTPVHLCFSYTPDNYSQIFNASVLVGAFLARLGRMLGKLEYLAHAQRSMKYLADHQQADGSWKYGAAPRQAWVDGFHTGYNLCALLNYQNCSGDDSFQSSIQRGYELYSRSMFTGEGIAKYYRDSLYPIDIHSCAQGVITFCEFAQVEAGAAAAASKVLNWTLQNMQSADGSFYYQRHRRWVHRTPFMRWGQAWMFHALSRYRATCIRQQQQQRELNIALQGRRPAQ